MLDVFATSEGFEEAAHDIHLDLLVREGTQKLTHFEIEGVLETGGCTLVGVITPSS